MLVMDDGKNIKFAVKKKSGEGGRLLKIHQSSSAFKRK
jgi:hypothetical protein